MKNKYVEYNQSKKKKYNLYEKFIKKKKKEISFKENICN